MHERTTNKNEIMNFKETKNKEEYMRVFRGKKEKGEIM